MLKVANLKKHFLDKSVLRNISFDANNAELTVIEGKNGAGKTTLFNILSGIIADDGGSITLDALDLRSLSAAERSLHFAVLRQDPASSTVIAFSVIENCALAMLKARYAGLHVACGRAVRHAAMQHFAALGLDYVDNLDQPLTYFSGGQRQMQAFALATIKKPSILLLDEPTAALDEQAAAKLMELVKRFLATWQIPAIMISHDHDLNRRYADVIYVLHNGELIPSH
jgi:putative tryptophan/tyrosine transport system ATP-binding protein